MANSGSELKQLLSSTCEWLKGSGSESDVVITTAAVPGRKAPVLITGEMVRQMRHGSIIVDLAAETGGNCSETKPGETILIGGVRIIGMVNVPSTIPNHASLMYAKNVSAFLLNLLKGGKLQINTEDPLVKDSLLATNGEVVHPDIRKLLGLPLKA